MMTSNTPTSLPTTLPAAKLEGVSAIIVNFNGLRFLEPCIESLRSASIHESLQIIVVDNASSDGSQDWLSARKDITYVESKENLGFTGGNNLGAGHATYNKLLFINNDTVVNTSLAPLVDLLKEPDCGIAGCRLVYGDGRQQFSIGYEHTPIRIVLSWLGLEKRHWLPKVFRRLETNPDFYAKCHRNVDWISGACFVTTYDLWTMTGGFDTDIFMYCEDVDLCLRIKKLGFRIAYTNDSLVTHYEGSGRPWSGLNALHRSANSYQILTAKNYGHTAATAMAFSLSLIFFLRSIVFYLKGFHSGGRAELYLDKSKAFRSVATDLLLKMKAF